MIRLALATMFLVWIWPLAAQDADLVTRHGRTLLAKNCARCHAVDRARASPHRQAPPFRLLGRRYPIESLAEALAEGLITGHPDMPEFVFQVRDVEAIMAYLQSIQVPQAAPTQKRKVK
jgi:mono/diheme cytochrome c family protein